MKGPHMLTEYTTPGSIEVRSDETLYSLLTQRIERTGEDTVIATRKTGPGRWEQITTGEFHRMVLAAAKGFIAFGIRKATRSPSSPPPAGNGVYSTSRWPRSAR